MNLRMSDELKSFDQRAVIKVCGLGGGGGNAVTRMIESGLSDVEFIAINTDSQALKQSPAATRLQIGVELTGGLGSGANPEVGRQAALDDRERITDLVRGADMVFVTAGLGGGTGTGAAPVVAEAARENGALTVGIVTMPFSFEGEERYKNANTGLDELEEVVDTLIVVPNDRVAALCQNNISLLHAFRQADEVLHNGVRAITELITIPGIINVDFADVRTIMKARGRALMGIGIAEGEGRARRAAEEAIICPLLEQSNINGAMGVIVNVKGGCDIGMREVQDAVEAVQQAAHAKANIIFGAVIDEEERPELEVTVIAAGFRTAGQAVDLEYEETTPESTHVLQHAEDRDDQAPDTEPVEEERRLATAVGAESLSAVDADLSQSKEPEIQYLFPDAEPAQGAGETAEPEEDMSIPAFMRRRKRKA